MELYFSTLYALASVCWCLSTLHISEYRLRLTSRFSLPKFGVKKWTDTLCVMYVSLLFISFFVRNFLVSDNYLDRILCVFSRSCQSIGLYRNRPYDPLSTFRAFYIISQCIKVTALFSNSKLISNFLNTKGKNHVDPINLATT